MSPQLSSDDIAWLASLATKPKQKLAVADPPTQIKEHHQLLHLDFWFVMLSTGCMLLASSTLIDAVVIEPLWLSAICLNMFAVSSLLSRDKEKINIYKIDASDLVRLLPSKPPSKVFKLAQLRMGIKPVE